MTDFAKLASNFQQYFGDLRTEGREGADSTTLSWLAKTAAREYLVNKVPLNDSIIKLAEQEKNLNNEHLKRISEMANNEVFSNLFENSTDKNVHFELANADQITTKMASTTKTASYNLSSYRRSPMEKLSEESEGKRWATAAGNAGGAIGGLLGLAKSMNSPVNSWKEGLTNMGVKASTGFLGGQILGRAAGHAAHHGYNNPKGEIKGVVAPYSSEEKTANYQEHGSYVETPFWDPQEKIINEYGHADPKKDLQDIEEKLEVAKEHILTEKQAAGHNLGIAYKQLYSAVKEELRDTSFSKVAQAMYSVTTDPEDLNVLEQVSYDLMKQKVATIDQLNVGLSKVASLSINKEHPLIQNFLGYVKLANQSIQLDYALEEIEGNLDKVATLLNKKKKTRV